jgi:hypothetical protein
MYNSKQYASNFTTNGTTDATLQVVPVSFSFTVEEDQMWSELEFWALANNNHATDSVFINFAIDGTLVTGSSTVGGVAMAYNALTTTQTWMHAKWTTFIPVGTHVLTVLVRGTVNGQTVTLTNATGSGGLPCLLSVTRLSNNAVLAHGVDSKANSVNE